MRVAVIGSGEIGGPLGAAFAQAGDDVTFVARGQHLAAMKENVDFLPRSGGVRSERHAAARMVTSSMLARASAGVR